MYYLWGTDDVTNEGVCQYCPWYRSCVGEHSEGMEHNAGVRLGEFQDFIQKQNENCSHAIVGEPFTEFCGQNERDGFGIGDFSLGGHCTKFKSLSMGRDGARLTMSMSFYYYLFVIFLGQLCVFIGNLKNPKQNEFNERDYYCLLLYGVTVKSKFNKQEHECIFWSPIQIYNQ